MSGVTMKVTSDFTKDVLSFLKSFEKDAVLVGIPEAEAARSDDTINNAAIMAINEFGSPVNNIPPRPVMSYGVEYSREKVAAEFKKAAVAVLEGNSAKRDIYYNRAGLIASNGIKKAINDQVIEQPLALSTIRKRYFAGFKGTKYLIVTGQLRNAITYVLRGA